MQCKSLMTQAVIREVTYFNTHAVEVIQSLNEARDIATMSHLIRVGVMFEGCPVDVVVRRVAIDESVEEEGIEGKPP